MYRIIFAITLCLSIPCTAFTAKPIIKVVSEEWTDYTNADKSGTYWDIIRAVYGGSYQLELTITNWSRALKLVESGKADIVIGSYKKTSHHFLFPKHHLDIEYPVYAIYDKKTLTVDSVDDLAGLTIAGKKDYNFPHFLPHTSHFFGVNEIHNVVKLIRNKRVNAALAYEYNLQLADPNKAFTHKVVIPRIPIYLAFTQSDLGRNLSKVYDKRIIELIKSNSLQQYFPSEHEFQHAQLSLVMTK
jgi:polar amino acid transport system substrate-binding protein